jgi:hypothetical protein
MTYDEVYLDLNYINGIAIKTEKIECDNIYRITKNNKLYRYQCLNNFLKYDNYHSISIQSSYIYYYSIFSSTFSDEGMVDEIPLNKFNIPFKNIGTKLDNKSVKNIIIKTNKKL